MRHIRVYYTPCKGSINQLWAIVRPMWLSRGDKMDSLHELVSFVLYIIFSCFLLHSSHWNQWQDTSKLLFNRMFYTISIYLMQWNSHIHAISNLPHPTQPNPSSKYVRYVLSLKLQCNHLLTSCLYFTAEHLLPHPSSNLSNRMWTLTSTTFSLTVSLECSLSLRQYQPTPHPQKM